MASMDMSTHHAVDVDATDYMTNVILLRNAKPAIDPLQLPRDWLLDEDGERQAMELVKRSDLHDVSVIYSSPEMRARKTVEPLADYLGVPIIVIDDLRDAHLDRYYHNKTEYLLMMEAKFLNPTLDIGESHMDALARFHSQLEGIKSFSKGSSILVVTHGTILSLYLGFLSRMRNKRLFNFWKNLPYCYYEDL